MLSSWIKSVFFEHICYNILIRSNLNLLGSFFIYFVKMETIVQVDLSGTLEQNSKNPANRDEVLTVDFNFQNVKLNK